MTAFTPEEALRIARLARLGLTPEEAERLAPTIAAITREFATLAAYADTLPAAAEPPAGPLRLDEVHPAPAAVVDAIVAAAPRTSAHSVKAPRGST